MLKIADTIFRRSGNRRKRLMQPNSPRAGAVLFDAGCSTLECVRKNKCILLAASR